MYCRYISIIFNHIHLKIYTNMYIYIHMCVRAVFYACLYTYMYIPHPQLIIRAERTPPSLINYTFETDETFSWNWFIQPAPSQHTSQQESKSASPQNWPRVWPLWSSTPDPFWPSKSMHGRWRVMPRWSCLWCLESFARCLCEKQRLASGWDKVLQVSRVF